MKIQRHIVHTLLALLLVLSQQMGISHAVSHWSGYRHGTEQLQDNDSSVSRGLALDHNCSQCLSFAQLANAIDTPSYSFPALDHNAPVAQLPKASLDCERTVCVFESRGPPQA